MNRLTIAIIVVLAALYVLFSSVFIVNERQQAIVTRFGEISRVHTEPGLYFKVPTDLVESVQIVEDRLLRYDLDGITLQVSGGKFYSVDAFVTYRISDLVKFRQGVSGNVQLAEQRLDARLNSALRQVYGLRDFEAALSAQRTEMMRETRDLLRAGMDDIGIDVVDVRVLRTDLTQQVSQQTFDRMSAERLAEAALLRARGQELAQTLRAQADRQAIQIVASANRDNEIVRGQGDAERNRVFANAYTQDPEFFEFFRSLQAYRSAFDGTNTNLVLSPNSAFFNYFGHAENANNPPTPAAELRPAPADLVGILTENEQSILGETLAPDPASVVDSVTLDTLLTTSEDATPADTPSADAETAPAQ